MRESDDLRHARDYVMGKNKSIPIGILMLILGLFIIAITGYTLLDRACRTELDAYIIDAQSIDGNKQLLQIRYIKDYDTFFSEITVDNDMEQTVYSAYDTVKICVNRWDSSNIRSSHYYSSIPKMFFLLLIGLVEVLASICHLTA